MPPAAPSPWIPLSIAAGGVAFLVWLILRVRLPAFLALFLSALLTGALGGMQPLDIPKQFADGLGGVLGTIAMIIGLGSVLGKLLEVSGGATHLAEALARSLGPARLTWAMALAGFFVGFPVWFSVGLVLMMPVLRSVTLASGQPMLLLAIPMLAGLSTAHGLVPPHPGPIAAIQLLQASPGQTILFSVLVGLPAVLISGPLLLPLFKTAINGADSTTAPPPAPVTPGTDPSRPTRAPGHTATLVAILLPIVLMLLQTLADLTLPKGHALRQAATFIGTPAIAMLVGVLAAWWLVGRRSGISQVELLRHAEQSLGPVATVLLVVGAGSGFSRVLIACGVGDAVAKITAGTSLSPLILGFIIASLIRVAAGSATVAITTAAGLMAPILATAPDTRPELLVIALGAGSSIASHVNDGGFWLVKEMLGITVERTLRTWTVMVSAMAVVALVLTLLLDWALGPR